MTAFIIRGIHSLDHDLGGITMNGSRDIALQQTGSIFSFKSIIAALFQLNLRDKLSATNRDDGAVHWGL